jgi:hypothetical protein
MNGPAVLYAFRWLVHDTFRQAAASRVSLLMLGVTGLCTVFCLGVSVEGGLSLPQPGDIERYDKYGRPVTGTSQVEGKISLLFGAFQVEMFRDRVRDVHFLQALLAGWVAGGAGLLLTLVWTAGFLPDFLQPSSASVLLAKPLPRWVLLTGKYLGVVAFVAFQAAVFFAATWLALGLKTNVWLYGYLAGAPILVFHFAVVYSFGVLLAVLTRSTAACLFGSILFWLVCVAMNYGRYAALALPEMGPQARPLPGVTVFLMEAGYWCLPKPMDLVILLEYALGAEEHFSTASTLPEFKIANEHGHYMPELALPSMVAFAAGMIALAGHQLKDIDY